MPKNPLLEKEIQTRIHQVRYSQAPKTSLKRPVFYVVFVFLVMLTVLLSLLRY